MRLGSRRGARIAALCLLPAALAWARQSEPPAAPVKVFILAGQSNMEGHGIVPSDPKRNGGRGSLEFLVKDSESAPRFKRFVDGSGAWVTRDDVRISYGQRRGGLGAGYGANPDRIGPELGFGWVVGDAVQEPVLLIKCAWGGKSLAVDFRPPSSGKPEFPLGKTAEGDVGKYYRETLAQVKAALADLPKLVPGSTGTYVLSGFGWHQGWNDRISDPFVAEYERNLANLIRDLRKDLGTPGLPFVVAETGMSGLEEKHPRALALMKAQAAVADYPEFKGNVAFVGTRSFWRTPEQSPGSQGYHWNQNAETYTLIGEGMGRAMLGLLRPGPPPAKSGAAPVKTGEMAGYLLVPQEKVPTTFNAGFSMYVAAWPLLKTYPGNRMQTGLFGTWMFAQHEGPPTEKHYSDIEGGLGWWRDTRFATETPKFIMGGVAPDFVEWANGPGAGKGRDWNKPAGKYGVAQLSPWVLWPPDGLNLRQGTSGELFGYGYLPLPLTPAKAKTGGKDLPTGDQSWTLFVNSGNFKGPVAFFTPYFWSHVVESQPRFAGLLLDSRPSNPNRALQMETQHVPAAQSVDARGESYARIAPTRFPTGADGNSVLVHRIASYTRKALWDGVKAWLDGGAPSNGAIDPAESVFHVFTGKGGSSWKIYADGTAKDQKTPVAWSAFAEPAALDPHTFGYRWKPELVSREGSLVTLPEHYRLGKDKAGKPQWAPVPAAEVPAETGLKEIPFDRPKARRPEPYVTPEDPESSWKKPGPAAGPFQARLGDGSVVTYSWYRFADQPTLLNADLSKEEREAIQARVEQIHRAWTKEKEYLPPPTAGKLADLDPALLVTPPAGMEAGYVPIVTRQEAP